MKNFVKKSIKVLFVAIFCIGVGCQFNLVYADDYYLTDEQIEENTEIVNKYLVVNGERVYFNYDLAEKNNESEAVIEQGLLVETISNLYNDNKFDPYEIRGVSFPVWGNYCGPGHNGHNFKDPVTDILDAGCKQHDQCYKGMGYKKNCKCNKALVNYIDKNYNKMKSWKMKVVAKAIKTYFSTAGNLGC